MNHTQPKPAQAVLKESLSEAPRGGFVWLLSVAVGLLFSGSVFATLLWLADVRMPRSWAALRADMVWLVTSPFYGRVHRVSPGSLHASVRSASELYKVPQELIWAVITVESNFNVRARSRVGAMGLMQLMPDTAQMLKVKDPYHPHDNIHGGARYLRMLLNQFHGDMKKAVAAYNAGPATVRRYRGIPPYPETRRYVARVLKLYEGQRRGTFAML